MIRFETTLGDFTIELFEKEAPESVANFQRYIEDEFLRRHDFSSGSFRDSSSKAAASPRT